MFKSLFDEKENVSNCIQLKTSVIKCIKNQLLDHFPDIESRLNHLMPKKDPVKIVRCHEHIEILTVNGELHLYSSTPTSKGAIKFVLSGSNIMCPGLTSPGAKLYSSAIMVEGKQYALCVGVMKMSAENIHYHDFPIYTTEMYLYTYTTSPKVFLNCLWKQCQHKNCSLEAS
uniref:MCTS1 re-initiation and release factor n=1 Tax=Oncorhynchus kisutch TaxID=8019 RepID=A0A8C7I5Y4_ONCKI